MYTAPSSGLFGVSHHTIPCHESGHDEISTGCALDPQFLIHSSGATATTSLFSGQRLRGWMDESGRSVLRTWIPGLSQSTEKTDTDLERQIGPTAIGPADVGSGSPQPSEDPRLTQESYLTLSDRR